MGARDRIEGKQRRTTTIVRVPLADPTEAEEALEQAQTFLTAELAKDAQPGADAPSRATLQAQVVYDGALARVEECFEPVELAAMEPAEFEALLAEHAGEDGELDVETFRPILVAACATDPELKEPAWWAEQFASKKWALGEREAMYVACWRLNFSPPRGRLGKG